MSRFKDNKTERSTTARVYIYVHCLYVCERVHYALKKLTSSISVMFFFPIENERYRKCVREREREKSFHSRNTINTKLLPFQKRDVIHHPNFFHINLTFTFFEIETNHIFFGVIQKCAKDKSL